MNKIKYILGVAAALCLAATSVQAQTSNDPDSLRTNTWSIYIHGGASNFHGVKSPMLGDPDKCLSPQLDLGFDYHIKPWVRIGMNFGYTMMKAIDKDILYKETVNEQFRIKGRPAPLLTESYQIQNKHTGHIIAADANVDFNLVNAFARERKSTWFNLYAGVGVGYMFGWDRNVQTWANKSTAMAEGDGYTYYYNHTEIESDARHPEFEALYIPFTLSAEFDIYREWTLGLVAQYKLVTLSNDYSPAGLYNLGVSVRYNFVKSTGRVYRERIARLNEELENYRNLCEEEKAAIAAASAAKIAEMEAAHNAALKELEDLRRQLNDCRGEIARMAALLAIFNQGVSSVYFDNNSADLNGDLREMDQLAAILSENPEVKVALTGSANATGEANYNKRLSKKRADAVSAYLISKGVKEEQIISVVGIGFEGMTIDPECRRVEILSRK